MPKRLHIAKIPGVDGVDVWLVVPLHESDLGFRHELDRIAALRQSKDKNPNWFRTFGTLPDSFRIRTLGGFRGWLVPNDLEDVLWAAVHNVGYQNEICEQCLHDAMPCDDWIRVVTERFERARRQIASFRDEPRGWSAPGYERVEPKEKPKKPSKEELKRKKEDAKKKAAKTLEVEWPCEREAITRAFRKAAMKAHPDLGGTDAAMRDVLEARDVLLSQEN